jgi:hypothetical protein
MNPRVRIPTLTMLVCTVLLSACASSPPPPATPAAAAATVANPASDAKPPPPPGQRRYKWSKATEAEVAAQLDKKFQEAAKAFVQLKRDDQLMFCKNYKDIGSNVRRLRCITEAELRKQVEDSDDMRDQMRQTMGRCTLGQKVACSAGQ